MGSKISRYDLENITDYTAFEDLCSDLMQTQGFPKLIPMGGMHDKGRDALHIDDRGTTIFAYSVREDWRNKLFNEDIPKVHKHNHRCDCFVFLTTEVLSAPELDDAIACAAQDNDFELEIYDLDRLSTLVDNNLHLVKLHPGIFPVTNLLQSRVHHDFDPLAYSKFLLTRFSIWKERYTALQAEFREFATFVQSRREGQQIPVTDVPDQAEVSFIVGESGCGKTVSLWQILVNLSIQLELDPTSPIPILVSLGNWSSSRKSVIDLIQDQFEPLGFSEDCARELLSCGSVVLLIDALNEVDTSDRKDCFKQVLDIVSTYSTNRFVFTCRSAEFSGDLLPIDKLPNRPASVVYEIARLAKHQIHDFAERQLTAPEYASFIVELELENDDAWQDSSSILSLSRIPLFLQLLIDNFQEKGRLLADRPSIYHALAHRLLANDDLKGASLIARESVSCELAYQTLQSEYELVVPETKMQDYLQSAVAKLKNDGTLPSTTTWPLVWHYLLSCNVLRSKDRSTIEWLHQIIRDYFAGVLIARQWSSERKRPTTSDPSILAIALWHLGTEEASPLLQWLIDNTLFTAPLVYALLSREYREQIAMYSIQSVIDEGDYETNQLKNLLEALPFYEMVLACEETMATSPDKMSPLLSEALAEMVTIHHTKLKQNENSTGFIVSLHHGQDTRETKLAIKRAVEIMKRWVKHKNGFVAFQSCKGIWAHDRDMSVQALRALLANPDQAVVREVVQLIDDWDIQ